VAVVAAGAGDVEEAAVTDEQRKRFLAIKESAIRVNNEEWMMRQHGRIISGYCSCCGAVRELDSTCVHSHECITEPDGVLEFREER
jgi:hypothetical protein